MFAPTLPRALHGPTYQNHTRPAGMTVESGKSIAGSPSTACKLLWVSAECRAGPADKLRPQKEKKTRPGHGLYRRQTPQGSQGF